MVFICASLLGVTSPAVLNMIEQKTDIGVMGRVMNLYSKVFVQGPRLGALLFELGTRRLGLNSIVLIYPVFFAIPTENLQGKFFKNCKVSTSIDPEQYAKASSKLWGLSENIFGINVQ